MKKTGNISLRLLWGAMIVLICGVAVVVVYTNITLRSIEKNLPNKLLTELDQLSVVLESMTEVVSVAKVARNDPGTQNMTRLHEKVAGVYNHVVKLRESYVFDNLIQASAFHAVVAPAIADLQVWLAEGVSGFPPDSEATLAIIESRITLAFQKARAVNQKSRIRAQEILEQQRSRLDRFLFGVNLLFLLTTAITSGVIFLLVRQHQLQIREVATQVELLNQRDLLNSLLENISLGITLWNPDGKLLHINREFTEITGYGRSDIQTLKHLFQIAFPDPEYRRRLVVDWKASQGLAKAVREFKATCKNGREKDIEFRGGLLPDGRILVTLMDITDRKQAEKALQESRNIQARSRKMESLGLLAGGVAHDLNNILSGIVNYPELLLLDLPEDSKLRKPIETMQAAGNRAAAIVLDLLTVARGVASAKEPLNLNQQIDEYLHSPEFEQLLRVHPALSVAKNLQPDLLHITASPAHIRKVLMNLVMNAAEAIEGNGKVTLSTINRYIDQPLRNYDDVKIGEYAVLQVADDGSGISAGDLERIFEPFYTKKVMGRSGTGLGLAVVWNVVQDHDGYINVESNDSGSTFELFFPITRKAVLNKEIAEPIDHYRGNGESVLVVDDIESQREIVCRMLETLGFRAVSAASGEEAVSYMRKESADLMVLDMIMDPGIDGRETYKRILEFHPNQKAIITSGFAETNMVKEAQALGAGQYLRKPFTLEALGMAIQKELQKDQP